MTTITDALVAFLRARLDETEATALAVPTIEGTVPPAHFKQSTWPKDEGKVLMGTAADFPVPTAEHAAHIAAHDPASVVADVAAKRTLLAFHWTHIASTDEGERPGCVVCGYVTGAGCPTLLALASAYAEHRDYDRSWALPL